MAKRRQRLLLAGALPVILGGAIMLSRAESVEHQLRSTDEIRTTGNHLKAEKSLTIQWTGTRGDRRPWNAPKRRTSRFFFPSVTPPATGVT